MTVKDFVDKDNPVYFYSYKKGFFYYNVKHLITEELYCFPVPLDDIGGGELLHTDKSVYYMRWINKALYSGTLTKECS